MGIVLETFVTPHSTVLIGGSFDPPHEGHVALAHYLAVLFAPDVLRILPAGNPWQKTRLSASADDRLAMARLAFQGIAASVIIDSREVDRSGPTYTVDTLQELRSELSRGASLILAVGADQLARLNTWQDWRSIFDLTHLCVVSRPGYSVAQSDLPDAVRRELVRRTASAMQLRAAPHGLCHVATGLAVDVSSTQIREHLRNGCRNGLPVPSTVLDYIQDHHLYQS